MEVASQLSDENVIVHFLPPILELCALQQQLLAGQLNVFVRCEKTYSLPIRKPSRFLEMRKRQDFGKKRIVICYWPDLS